MNYTVFIPNRETLAGQVRGEGNLYMYKKSSTLHPPKLGGEPLSFFLDRGVSQSQLTNTGYSFVNRLWFVTCSSRTDMQGPPVLKKGLCYTTLGIGRLYESQRDYIVPVYFLIL